MVRAPRVARGPARARRRAGAPVLGASVFLLAQTHGVIERYGRGPTYAQTVDDRGHYRLYGIPPGEYSIVASYRGGSATSNVLSLRTGEEYQNINLTVTPGPAHSIEGQVSLTDSGSLADGGGRVLVTLARKRVEQFLLAVGATVVLYDGNPNYPDLGAMWNLIDEEHVTIFGCSASYLLFLKKEGFSPRQVARLDFVLRWYFKKSLQPSTQIKS